MKVHMKTITLDYETYQNELKEARTQGIPYIKEIKIAIENLIKSTNGHNANDFYEARHQVYKILQKLDENVNLTS